MSPMRLQLANESDKEYFRSLNKACYHDVICRQFGEWDEDHQNNSFATKWPTHNFRKIYVGDELVGGVWTDDAPDFVQLREIQIHPDYQGHGIGTRIVQAELEHARAAGKVLRLRVLFENQAIQLYKRLGFRIVDANDHQHIMECN